MIDYNENKERYFIQSSSMSDINGKIYKSKVKYKTALTLSIVSFIVIFLLVSLFSAAEVAYVKTYVKGSSMQPTLNYSEETISPTESLDVVYLNSYNKGKRGDIIVDHVYYAPNIQYVIKRLIAIEGDTLRIVVPQDDSPTQVYVNGELLDEPYLLEKHFKGLNFLSYDEEENMRKYPELNPKGNKDDGTITIPKGYVFYMGDNRNKSEDCRGVYRETQDSDIIKAGPRPARNIVGAVEFVLPRGEGDIPASTLFWNGVNAILNNLGKTFLNLFR